MHSHVGILVCVLASKCVIWRPAASASCYKFGISCSALDHLDLNKMSRWFLCTVMFGTSLPCLQMWCQDCAVCFWCVVWSEPSAQGRGIPGFSPDPFSSIVIAPLVDLICSQGFFFWKSRLVYFSLLNSMEFCLFPTKTICEDEARIKPSLLFFLHLILVDSENL